jgi:fido (protein-threonine AMPylation protein)
MNESEGSDATPLDPVELANTIRGEEWAFSHRHRDLLNSDFIRTLHRRMFDETWIWAGPPSQSRRRSISFARTRGLN